MKKLKTKKTLAKRIRVTKTGKVMRKQIGIGHLKIKMDSSRKHRKQGLLETSKMQVIKFKRMLGL